MELRSRRKLSIGSIANATRDNNGSSSDDETDDSILNSDEWLLSDGDFESDEDSDVETLSRKMAMAVADGEADACTTSDKSKEHVHYSNKKTKGSGSTSKAAENEDVMGIAGNEHGLQGLPSGDGNDLDSSREDVIDEIPNVPSADVESPVRKRKRGDKPKLLWQIWEKENKEWVKETIDEVIDLENHNERVDETAEPSSDLTMPLLRYQKEWLAWAIKQEASETKGGILADEMGMGKTIQAIALVLAKRECSQAASQFVELSLPGESSTGLPAVKGTLVICPLVAVTQWESEINRFTAKGSTKVLIYHGASRGKCLGQLSEYDFVLTTYALVESEYRRNVMPAKKPCVYCGKLFQQSKMSVHLKYFCGPHASRTANQAKQQRKKGKSKNHAEELSPSTKNIKKAPKASKIDSNAQHSSSMENGASSHQSESKGTSILHSVKWERIILDEAHSIKDRKCNTAKAVFALESSFKWALSGTPLQNRVGELYSLIRFLHINPYSYYFCKDCDCKTLDYSASSDCKSCPHKSVRHFCWWNKFVATPIQNWGYSGEGKNAMVLLKNRVLKGIVLRRTKKGRAADLALPPRIVSLRRDNMDIKEEDYYTSLYNESQAEFNTYDLF
uniref:Helicase ATP-binding domain-containing protein n=1 Tax=Kalanchoe fedtschenkoi TaxID=63787 RepID=A0A7N0TAN8_KALFE